VLESARFETVRRMCAGYKPTLPLAFVSAQLLFPDLEGAGDEAKGLAECLEWMKRHGAQVKEGAGGEAAALDCTPSVRTLFMPRDEDAVAHGDANLSIEKFFAGM
jgi:hypothetical protein